MYQNVSHAGAVNTLVQYKSVSYALPHLVLVQSLSVIRVSTKHLVCVCMKWVIACASVYPLRVLNNWYTSVVFHCCSQLLDRV